MPPLDKKKGTNKSTKADKRNIQDENRSLPEIQNGDRNYSCSYLVNLDHNLMKLLKPNINFVDSALKVLVGHAIDVLARVSERRSVKCIAI